MTYFPSISGNFVSYTAIFIILNLIQLVSYVTFMSLLFFVWSCCFYMTKNFLAEPNNWAPIPKL